MTKNYSLLDNDSKCLAAKIFAIKHIRNLGYKKCKTFGWRFTKDKQLFYIYSGNDSIKAETIVSIKQQDGAKKMAIVSVASINFKFNKKHKTFHIEFISTKENYQNMGIGQEMLNYAKKLAKKMGATSVTLDCRSRLTNGIMTIDFRDEKYDRQLKNEMQKSGKIIDINLSFYLNNGFIKQKCREPAFDYLIPMHTNNLNTGKPPIVQTRQIHSFKNMSVRFSPEKVFSLSKETKKKVSERKFSSALELFSNMDDRKLI